MSENNTLDDRQLADLYCRHGSALYRYLLGRTFGDAHLAEDILQETFLRAWRAPNVVAGQRDICRAWLVTVARNIVIDRLRNRACRPQETTDSALPTVPAQNCEMERVVTALTVHQAMATLTPMRREILVQLYLKDRPLKQVADALGIPIGTVKSRANAALRALRATLDEAPTAEPVLCAA